MKEQREEGEGRGGREEGREKEEIVKEKRCRMCKPHQE
jgi:hypothetical protein